MERRINEYMKKWKMGKWNMNTCTNGKKENEQMNKMRKCKTWKMEKWIHGKWKNEMAKWTNGNKWKIEKMENGRNGKLEKWRT